MTNTDPHAMRSCDRISRCSPRLRPCSSPSIPFAPPPTKKNLQEMGRNFSLGRTCKTALAPLPPYICRADSMIGPPTLLLLYGICNVNGRLWESRFLTAFLLWPFVFWEFSFVFSYGKQTEWIKGVEGGDNTECIYAHSALFGFGSGSEWYFFGWGRIG